MLIPQELQLSLSFFWQVAENSRFKAQSENLGELGRL